MRIFIATLFVVLTNISNAQKSTYLADLETLRSILQKSAS
jgi:hypothetical protein